MHESRSFEGNGRVWHSEASLSGTWFVPALPVSKTWTSFLKRLQQAGYINGTCAPKQAMLRVRDLPRRAPLCLLSSYLE